jgi:uridine phosphorylase
MRVDDAIVKPVKGKRSPDLGPLAVMAGTRADLSDLRRILKLEDTPSYPLYTSSLYADKSRTPDLSLAGPMVGAPYAVMILETLISWGAEKIVFYGWGGAVSPEVRIGDIIVPTAAVIDEGTSAHYRKPGGGTAAPSARMVDALRRALSDGDVSFHEGTVWSTDAIYRETPEKVLHHQGKGVLAVEMEISALFSAGAYRNVEVGAVVVVSDELSSLKWRPGFRDERFRKGRAALCEGIASLCRKQ